MINLIKGIYGIVKRQKYYDHACSLMTVAGRPATQMGNTWFADDFGNDTKIGSMTITRHRMLAVLASDTEFSIPAILDVWDRCKSVDIVLLAAQIAHENGTDLLEGYIRVGKIYRDNTFGRN